MNIDMTTGGIRTRTARPGKAELVFAQLRTDILNGRLAPGQRLGHVELGSRYEVGTGVLREVLPRLVERGLATSEPQLGFRVISLSVKDLRELTDARLTIEPLVLRRSIEHGGIDWEGSVVAAHHRLSRLPMVLEDGTFNTEWLEQHERFHQALLEGCGNERLVGIAAGLRDVGEVYRCWSQLSPAKPRDIAGEHALIAQATVSRDVDIAAEALASHIALTTEQVIQSWQASLNSTDGADQDGSTVGVARTEH